MSHSYWNDLEIEKVKPYFVCDKEDRKLLNYIVEESNIKICFEDALKYIVSLTGNEIKGRILEIGAGVCWTTAIVSRFDNVKEIWAIDFSKHRLKLIAPVVFEQLGGDFSKFIPVVGDFEKLNFENESFDFIIFCQSLYMFSDINKILSRTHSLLKKGGIVVIACERIAPNYPLLSFAYLNKQLIRLLRGKADISGKHFYEDKEYEKAIYASGFNYIFQELSYPILKKNMAKAGNYFGVKTE